jgi:hypothetical protein
VAYLVEANAKHGEQMKPKNGSEESEGP